MKAYSLLMIFIIGMVFSYGQSGKAFQYIESSTGMNDPEWESGKSELEFADINMDGFVDILTIGDHSSPSDRYGCHGIMVYFGDGTGSWSLQMSGNFGYGGIAIGDANNDGIWDVGYGMHHAYSSSDFGDQLLEVALGDGTGMNWTPWDDGLATNGEDWGLFGTDFADVDNDGDLDIGTNSFGSGSGLHVYINQGDGTWVQSYGIMEGNSNHRFVFGDINNDGNTDFVVTHDAGIAFFGYGDGDFYNADYNLPNYSWPMIGPDLGDVNKDGGKDLAYINPDGGIDVWTFDNGTSQWQDISGSLPASGDFQAAELCDFNSDGTMDLAAFGDANLTIWKGIVTTDPESVSWEQVFNTATSNNGDCSAFRTGGDVDRNGYPDITLVEKVGNWPSDKNVLKCFRETSPVFLHYIKAVYPRGNEIFKQGSVQFTDWITAVSPSSTAGVKIEYSLKGRNGPFIILTEDFANGGRYQWTIPQTLSSNNCYMRYTLIDGNDTLIALTPKAFTILGEEGIEADFTADSTLVFPNSQIQFTDQSLGMLTSWEWDFDNDGSVDATERNPVHAYDTPGDYTVKLTVSDGTNIQSETKVDYITVQSGTGTSEINYDQGFLEVVPNPFRDKAKIKFQVPPGKLPAQLQLLDLQGRCLQVIYPGHQDGRIQPVILNAGDLPQGIYLIRLGAGDSVILKKIIILN